MSVNSYSKCVVVENFAQSAVENITVAVDNFASRAVEPENFAVEAAFVVIAIVESVAIEVVVDIVAVELDEHAEAPEWQFLYEKILGCIVICQQLQRWSVNILLTIAFVCVLRQIVLLGTVKRNSSQGAVLTRAFFLVRFHITQMCIRQMPA